MTEEVSADEDSRLSEVLFNQKAYQILAQLLDNSDEEFSISEIKDSVDVSRPVISKVVDSLKDIGVVNKRKKGNLYLISVNVDSTYYKPLQEILQLDSRPLKEAAEELLEKMGKEELLHDVVSVYLFGSVARGVPRTDSDIDLLFVHDDLSEEKKESAQNFVAKMGKRLNVSFSVTWYGRKELRDQKAHGVAFTERVEEEGENLYGEELW